MERNLFNRCMPVIFQHEGGLADLKNDHGGTTNFGISLLFFKGLPDADHDGWLDGDINRDGVVNQLDIKALTEEKAKQVYFTYFWSKWYNLIESDLLVLHLFDMAVNAGPVRAHKMVQQIVKVPQDGALGQITAAAINQHKGDIVLEYIMKRREFYRAIVDADPTQHRFLAGWLNRIETTKFITSP